MKAGQRGAQDPAEAVVRDTEEIPVENRDGTGSEPLTVAEIAAGRVGMAGGDNVVGHRRAGFLSRSGWASS
jgi:hypothetical protein